MYDVLDGGAGRGGHLTHALETGGDRGRGERGRGCHVARREGCMVVRLDRVRKQFRSQTLRSGEDVAVTMWGSGEDVAVLECGDLGRM